MYTILNAAPDTGNQGVSALCLAAVAGLSTRGLSGIAVADHGRGSRPETWKIGDSTIDVTRFGLTNSRRLWRADNLRNVRIQARFGGAISPSARVIAKSRAILDVSGGDSFTDLYGPRRFQSMELTKRLALDNNIPLILLPQKLGPFNDRAMRTKAIDILRGAKAVFLRDAHSFDFVRDALGQDFDPERHHLGPDMATLLPRTRPAQALPDTIARWLAAERDAPLAGLNVSGLLCHKALEQQSHYGLADPHDIQIDAAANAILDSDPDIRLLLISHVQRPEGDPESDFTAAQELKLRLGDRSHRVEVLPQSLGATELKWVLAQLDWFAGARMHATIGAFSSGVPTLGLGYSDKAYGTFAQCGIGDEVADLRKLTASDLYDAVQSSVAGRADLYNRLASVLPSVKKAASVQMDTIAAAARAN
ncbi:MAG: polysaccharide pyruvyl transferase family protein [Pseudoprimorskyibacter sp.]|nr:polysaccharide pyruvyl transferase family protein [Pseudoprimorskyibacter sp.]